MDEKKTRHDGTAPLDRGTIAEQMKAAGQHTKQAFIVVVGGLDLGKVVRLGDGVTVLGRETDCTVQLRDDGISRHHAQIERVAEDVLRLRDLGSTNGTYVNGEQVRETTVRDGEKFLLGRRTIVRFTLQDEIDLLFQQQVFESAVRDGLTGIHNRRHFDAQLGTFCSYARRHRVPLSLIMMDIDHFKAVNDTHGHPAGDQVLIAVSNALAGAIRSEDVLARIGGEEFAVIALGVDAPGGQAFAERLRTKVERLAVPLSDGEGAPLAVTLSAGVATAPPDGEGVEPQDLVAAADRNLYAAKHAGRNRVVAERLR